jgi:transcriptional regulator with XRE-family HTH domain
MRRDADQIRSFGANLRAARLQRGLSQTDLARDAELAVSEISRIERGVREVRVTTLLRLLHALGAAPDELLGGIPLGDGKPSREGTPAPTGP